MASVEYLNIDFVFKDIEAMVFFIGLDVLVFLG